MNTFDIKKLKIFCESIMCKAGLNHTESSIFTDSLLFANMRGIDSHGISRLSTYSKRVESGVIKANTDPKLTKDYGSLMHFDGQHGIGASTALKVMHQCIDRAKMNGICFASVNNGTHFGTGAYFTKYAAEKNMIGFAISNSEAAVVPTGGAKPMLGTNPLSVSIPSGNYNPLVLDMATSVVARGKVKLAQKEGKEIPNHWSVDCNGLPTTSPDAALEGAMLPFGGPKGYAISLIIDLMCSSFAGALNSRTTPLFWDDYQNHQNVGYFIGAIDVSKAFLEDGFLNSVDEVFKEFKDSETAPDVDRVMIPGEIEDIRAQEAKENGITLSDAVTKDLIDIANHYDVAHPFI